MSSISEEVLARAGTFFLANIRSVTQAAQTEPSLPQLCHKSALNSEAEPTMRAQTTVGLCSSVRERQCLCPSARYNLPCRSTISCPSASNTLPNSIYRFMSLCQQHSSSQCLLFYVPLPATIFHAVSTISCPFASNNLPHSIYHFMSLCQQQSSMQYLPFHVPLPATIFHTVSTILCPSASNNLPCSIYHFMSLCHEQSSMQYLPFHVPLPWTIFHAISTILILNGQASRTHLLTQLLNLSPLLAQTSSVWICLGVFDTLLP